jgi:hypothetical protein
MFKTSSLKPLAAAAGLLLAGAAQAAIIGFDGGTVTRNNNTTTTSSNSVNVGSVKSYVEQGFKIEFFFSTANPTAFSSNIGNYYGAGNAVIHAHWATGDFGNVTQIKITKVDGSAFDMNYFVLTSDTDTGGGAASGNEQAYIHASSDGVTDDYAQLLPPENWGFPARQVFLGSQFDSVKAVWFDVRNAVDCFGMDNFYIDEAAPGIPEPGSLALAALALGVAGATRRRAAR